MVHALFCYRLQGIQAGTRLFEDSCRIREGQQYPSVAILHEAYDFLDSERYPFRIGSNKVHTPKKRKEAFAAFSRTARESYMVSSTVDSDGRRAFFHVVRAGKSHELKGMRNTRYGPRIIPPAADFDDIIAWVRKYIRRETNKV